MRAFVPILAGVATFALAACGGAGGSPDGAETVVELDKAATGKANGQGPQPTAATATADADTLAAAEGATSLEQRVATIGLLNKRNNVSKDIEMRPGDVHEEGPVILRLATCERTAPWEIPQETGAFLQLDVLERGKSEHRRVFSGWLFKESPSLNVVEHPIYDVWIKDCAMSFPGDEDGAPKPEATPKATPAPTSTPAPATTPAAE